LKHEILRAIKSLNGKGYDTMLIGVADQGPLTVSPCRLLLPFHYPATIEELDHAHPSHFEFAADVLKNPNWQPTKSELADSTNTRIGQRYLDNWAFASFRNAPRLWSIRRKNIRYLAKLYEDSRNKEGMEFVSASDRRFELTLHILQEACAGFDPKLTIIGIESDSGSWWEVNTFHVSGPPIPPPPAPRSAVQVLARLCRHQHSYVGRSRFTIQRGVITEVAFDGACTTDATVDLLRGIPGLRELLNGLRKISLRHTLVTKQSLEFLRLQLPGAKISWSAYGDE
jgi:hypothetical protein